MSNHVYQILEFTGSSSIGSDEAVKNAIAKATDATRQIKWFEVVETRGQVQEGQVAHWQVTHQVGHTLP